MIDDLDLDNEDQERSEVLALLEQVAQTGTVGYHSARSLDVGTDAFLSFFESEILDQYSSYGGSTCRFFEGAWGSGKTHLLSLLESSATDRGMAFVQTELTTYLSLSNWDHVVRLVLQSISITFGDQQVRGLPNVLRAIKDSGRATSDKLKQASLPHPGFKMAMELAVTSNSIGHSLTRFLLGERVTQRALTNEGAYGVREPLNRKNAELVLETVTGGLFALGVPGTLLLFDETERTFQSNSASAYTRARTAANLMRRLVDASATGRLIGTIAVFAVLRDFIDESSQVYPALGQRLQRSLEADVAWRQPVLDIADISSLTTPEEFSSAVSLRFVSLIDSIGGDIVHLEERLLGVGRDVIESNAGSGYRRDLMKRLATTSLRFVN